MNRRPEQDWREQVRNCITTVAQLEQYLRLTDDEIDAIGNPGLPFSITPHYLSLIDRDDPHDPIRRAVIPTTPEQRVGPGELHDPLGEDERSPLPHVVHKYRDRVLLLVSNRCPVYCRYCTRGRCVGSGQWSFLGDEALEAAARYIEEDDEIHDVLLSGGEPLLMDDSRLAQILDRLRGIERLDFIRIGTKAPLALPQRVTPALCEMLRQYHPLFISVHVTHPNELVPESEQAFRQLADAGIPLGSQTVLLQGINDNAATLKALFRRLLRNRVRPYYLLQCDPITGSSHFRVPVERGLELMEALRGRVSGYAIPQYIIDIPGGAGKVPVSPNYIVGREDGCLLLRSFEGESGFIYPDS